MWCHKHDHALGSWHWNLYVVEKESLPQRGLLKLFQAPQMWICPWLDEKANLSSLGLRNNQLLLYLSLVLMDSRVKFTPYFWSWGRHQTLLVNGLSS